MLLKLFMKSIVPLIVFVLALGISLSIVSPSIASLAMMRNVLKGIEPSLGYELVLVIPIKSINVSQIEEGSEVNLSYLEQLDIESTIRKILDYLGREAYVKKVELLTPVTVNFMVKKGNRVIEGPRFTIIVVSKDIARECISIAPSIGIDTKIREIFKEFKECDNEALRAINKRLRFLRENSIMEVIETPFGISGVSKGSLSIDTIPPFYIVVNNFSRLIDVVKECRDILQKAIEEEVNLSLRFPVLHLYSVETYATGGGFGTRASLKGMIISITMLIDLYSDSYIRPASLGATKKLFIEVSKSIEKDVSSLLGVDVYAVQGKVFRNLDRLSPMEFVFRGIAIFTVVSSIIVLVIVSRSSIESAILSLRRSIALARSRGVRDREFSKSFIVTFLLFTLIGILAAYAIGFAISMYIDLDFSAIAMDLPTTIAIAITIVIIAIFAISKARKVLKEIPVTEASRQSLLPESLLGKERIGIGTLIILTIGLYHLVISALGFSASAYMATHPEALSSPAIMIALGIAAAIEGFTAPFAPAFFAYGIAKVIAVKGDELLSVVARFGGSTLDAIAKGMLMVKKKRVLHIVTLLIFIFALASSSFIKNSSMNAMFNQAVDLSIPGTEIGISLVEGTKDNITKIIKQIPRDCLSLAILHTMYIENVSGMIPIALLLDNEYLSQQLYIVLNIDTLRDLVKRYGDAYGLKISDLELLKEDAIAYVKPPFYSGFRKEIKSIRIDVMGSRRDLMKVSKVIELKQFPLVGSSEAIIVGPKLIEILLKDINGSSVYYRLSVLAICRNVTKLQSLGFSVYDRDELIKESIDISVQRALIESIDCSSYLSLSALLFMGIALLSVLSWSISLEIKKIYAILRVRGCGKSKVVAMTLIEWCYIAFLGIGLGLLFGVLQAYSSIKVLSETALSVPTSGGFIPFIQSYVYVDSIPIAISLSGVPPIYVVPHGLIAMIVIATILVIVIPLLIVLRIYSGTARERLIG